MSNGDIAKNRFHLVIFQKTPFIMSHSLTVSLDERKRLNYSEFYFSEWELFQDPEGRGQDNPIFSAVSHIL